MTRQDELKSKDTYPHVTHWLSNISQTAHAPSALVVGMDARTHTHTIH
jgi:hypothetical protein